MPKLSVAQILNTAKAQSTLSRITPYVQAYEAKDAML